MAAPAAIGRYQILSKLGQGGMSDVYLALDPVLDRKVAIKVIRSADDGDSAAQARFRREALAIARLAHPNIVTILDFGEHEGQAYIAMEYIEGESLAAKIRRQEPMPVSWKLNYLVDLMHGLAHAHRAGIVHRDIKPANVLITTEGVVKLLDFGIAIGVGASLTQPGAVAGTPHYMAPEQLLGEPVDARSDIYSVGVLAYELLSGHKPFDGRNLSDLFNRMLHQPIEPLATACPDLEPAVARVIEKALEKDAAQRYPSIETMRDDLGQAMRAMARNEVVVEAPPDFATMLVPRPAAGPGTSIAVPIPKPSDEGTSLFRAPKQDAGVPDVHLVVVSSADARLVGRTFKITGRTFQIGRNASDLSLPDAAMTRRHAEIEYTDAGFVINDLGSSNGTFVNGRQVIGAEPLYFGAVIRIGHTQFTFSSAQGTTVPDLSGCLIADRYTLKRLLRESAKGAVYVAQHRNLPNEVVVKLLSPELVRYPGYYGQFQHEAELAAELHHPNICKVIDYGPVEITVAGATLRTHYLCLPFMAGGDLAARLESRQPFPVEQSARWIEVLADALHFAHRHHVIHGNVKPTSVVFDPDENVYLTDFAIAQRIGDAGPKAVMGTAAYMAPEQWESGAVTPAIDQFALAALAYYMVSGSRPFEGQDHPEVRKQNFRRGPLLAHQEAAQNGREVPRATSEVLRRGLATSAGDRYPTVQEFGAALAAALRRRGALSGTRQVFLSYQREAAAGWAQLLARELKEKHGIGVFVDVERRDGAARFPARLAQAIEECDVFVCILGSSTLESAWVRQEIAIAHQHARPMVPVFQEAWNAPDLPPGADPPVETLISYDGVHLLDRRNIYVDHTIAELARLVKHTLTPQ